MPPGSGSGGNLSHTSGISVRVASRSSAAQASADRSGHFSTSVIADAVLPFTVTLERFEAVAGRRSQIREPGCGVKHIELAQRHRSDALELADRLAPMQCLGALVPEQPASPGPDMTRRVICQSATVRQRPRVLISVPLHSGARRGPRPLAHRRTSPMPRRGCRRFSKDRRAGRPPPPCRRRHGPAPFRQLRRGSRAARPPNRESSTESHARSDRRGRMRRKVIVIAMLLIGRPARPPGNTRSPVADRAIRRRSPAPHLTVGRDVPCRPSCARPAPSRAARRY